MVRFGSVVATMATLLFASPALAQSAEPIGVWLTEKGDARVKVSKCGTGICGVIVALKDPIDRATGQPQVDDKNPNPALRSRPVIGLSLFIGMRPSAPGKWSGQIYNADDGGTYVSHVTFSGSDALQVEGCVGMMCGGETWTRVGR
ncbi:MAG: DUF2147 domain-containing protein [Bradyrhizobium sp.]|nr:DUF2147 domain-containing protein [Bradyrhizobium sp.]